MGHCREDAEDYTQSFFAATLRYDTFARADRSQSTPLSESDPAASAQPTNLSDGSLEFETQPAGVTTCIIYTIL